jgi:ATP-dependent DNA helicase RecG
MLETKGLTTVEDLLAYTPLRYEDRSNLKPIGQLAPGEMATVIAEVKSGKVISFRRKNLGIFEAVLGDGSREQLVAKWFNAAYLADKLVAGVRLALYGKVELDSYTGDLLLKSPEY